MIYHRFCLIQFLSLMCFHIVGCRSIEHASFIDAAGIEACLENNTWIIPTFMIGEYYDEMGSKSGAQDRMIELAKQTRQR